MKKKNLRIMSKQYAHLHAMAKTSVKFQNDWPKTVEGVALTSQLLTNGQTDERTGHSTAGATKIHVVDILIVSTLTHDPHVRKRNFRHVAQ